MEKIKTFIKINLAYIIAFIIFIIIGFLLVNNYVNILHYFDIKIINFIEIFKSDTMTIIMKIITNLGSIPIIITILVIILLLIKDKKNRYYLLLNMITTLFIANTIKFIFLRSRPVGGIIEETGYSFPSAHSMTSIAFVGFIIYLISKSKFKYKKTAYISLSILILLIGISRIYLGVHFPTDVIFGFIYGFIYLLIFINTIKYNCKEEI